MYISAKNLAMPETGSQQNYVSVLSGVETTLGSGANDVFNSVANSVLAGGKGDDTYTLWQSSATVVEKAGEGIDTIYANFWGTAVLPDNVENLILGAQGTYAGTGNALGNTIVAGSFGATLDGLAGDDVLVGGAGADVFKIEAGNGSDAIYNFKSGFDVVQLSGYGFKSFADLKAHASQAGADVTIDLGNGEALVLRGIQLGTLQAADFGFSSVGSEVRAGDTVMTGAGQYFSYNGVGLLNNAWGASGLTANVDYKIDSAFNGTDLSSGTVFHWSFPNTTDPYASVKAYPEIIFGISPFGDTSKIVDPGHAFPVKVSDIAALSTHFDSTISGNTGGFNVAYDIWFTSIANGSQSSVTNEVMIWTHNSVATPTAKLVGTFSDGAHTGKIYHQDTYTALILDQDTPSGTLDLKAVFAKLGSLGILNSSEYLASIQFGSEVLSGVGSLTVNDLSVTMQTLDASGNTVTKVIDGTGTQTSIAPAATADTSAPVAEPVASGSVVSASPAALPVIEGDDGNNTLTGTSAAEIIRGHGGHDILMGGGGADSIVAGDGNNHLYGNALGGAAGSADGADTIVAGSGSNYINGNAGDDMITAGAAGSTGTNRILGGQGNDTITIYGSGANSANGNLGNDTIHAEAATGNNMLRGGQGDDIIYAGQGRDMLSGDLGNDTLVAGGAAGHLTIMTGGAGSDLFDFSKAGSGATAVIGGSTFYQEITDFTSGTDHIGFAFTVGSGDVLAGSAESVTAAQTWAQSALAGHVGTTDVAAVQVGADTYLFYNDGGSGDAITATLKFDHVTASTLSSGDFVVV